MLRVVDDHTESPYNIVPGIFDFLEKSCERFFLSVTHLLTMEAAMILVMWRHVGYNSDQWQNMFRSRPDKQQSLNRM